MKLCESFAEIVELATRLGVTDIVKLPGCWEHKVDEHWFFALNAHEDERLTTETATPQKVPPGQVYVEFNGWPAGIFGIDGGIIAAGALANEDTFIKALKASAHD